VSKPPRFLDLYHAGLLTAEQIEDYIDEWHTENPPVPLHVFLGMTWPEYRTWVIDRWLPTAEEHAQERADAVWTTDADGEGHILRVHPPLRCRPPCPAHWPSNHPLMAAPMWWDGPLGVMFRRCSHNELHPDPDDQQVRLHPELAEHHCDGCCTACVVDGEFFEPDEPLEAVVQAFDAATERGIIRRPQA
jgi:hypothetical protein